MNGFHADEELAYASGLGEEPSQIAVNPKLTELVEPAWLRADCTCRGGFWVEDTSGDPSHGHCNVGIPTGKHFDMTTHSCVPIPGYRPPQVQSVCTQGGVNICLYGGIAALIFMLLLVLKKD